MKNFSVEFLKYVFKRNMNLFISKLYCVHVCVSWWLLFSISKDFNIQFSSPLFVADPSFGMTLKMS